MIANTSDNPEEIAVENDDFGDFGDEAKGEANEVSAEAGGDDWGNFADF